MLYAPTLAIFRRKIGAASLLQLMQNRLAYTPNIYHKQYIRGGNHVSSESQEQLVLWFMKCKSTSINIQH